MSERALTASIIILLIINVAALGLLVARFQPFLRTAVAPGSVPSEVIETEQQLESSRQSGQATTDPLTLAACKKVLSDCRNYCQIKSIAENLSTSAAATCYSQCEQSFRLCQGS